MSDEIQNCLTCKNFDVEDQEPKCEVGCKDFKKQLTSGTTLVCNSWESDE